MASIGRTTTVGSLAPGADDGGWAAPDDRSSAIGRTTSQAVAAMASVASEPMTTRRRGDGGPGSSRVCASAAACTGTGTGTGRSTRSTGAISR